MVMETASSLMLWLLLGGETWDVNQIMDRPLGGPTFLDFSYLLNVRDNNLDTGYRNLFWF